MPLIVTDNRVVLAVEDTNAGDWDESTTSGYTEGQREGAGYVGYDVDIETNYNFDTITVIPANITGNHYGRWLRLSNASAVDTKTLGGIQLALRDGTGNESYWYVGGSDTYAGGWVYFVVDLDRTPDANNGSPAILTNALNFGVGFKVLAKSLDDNAHIDLGHYGTGGLVITGAPDTGTYGIDNAMQELVDVIETGNYGLLTKSNGVFVGKGPLQFNDNTTLNCTFEDSGSTFVWGNLPVSATFYKFSLGSSTGITIFRLGTVVGIGDSRQGVNGGSIFDAGQTGWGIDFATNLSANANNDIKLYGISLSNAKNVIKFDDGLKTSLISVSITNSNEIDLGITNNGAELLSFVLIDPQGSVNNYGLVFNQTPIATGLNHNVKKGSIITSGIPSTQYMFRLPYDGDYEISFTDIEFFGDFSSASLWHGLNEGLNADIVINSSGKTNTIDTEYNNTNGGTVVVQASVVLTINSNVSLVGAEIRIYDMEVTPPDFGTELAGVESHNAATYIYSGSGGNFIRIQILLVGYEEFSQTLTMPSADGAFTANLKVETNA